MGSIPITRFTEAILYVLCASGSVVEYRLAKARVAGSNPVSRSYLKKVVKIFFFLYFLPLVSNFFCDIITDAKNVLYFVL